MYSIETLGKWATDEAIAKPLGFPGKKKGGCPLELQELLSDLF